VVGVDVVGTGVEVVVGVGVLTVWTGAGSAGVVGTVAVVVGVTGAVAVVEVGGGCSTVLQVVSVVGCPPAVETVLVVVEIVSPGAGCETWVTVLGGVDACVAEWAEVGVTTGAEAVGVVETSGAAVVLVAA
jgi:hypothetical protein